MIKLNVEQILKEQGKSAGLVEFSIISEMGDDFLTERNYVKKDETSFHM